MWGAEVDIGGAFGHSKFCVLHKPDFLAITFEHYSRYCRVIGGNSLERDVLCDKIIGHGQMEVFHFYRQLPVGERLPGDGFARVRYLIVHRGFIGFYICIVQCDKRVARHDTAQQSAQHF